jgi:hypothetical protein
MAPVSFSGFCWPATEICSLQLEFCGMGAQVINALGFSSFAVQHLAVRRFYNFAALPLEPLGAWYKVRQSPALASWRGRLSLMPVGPVTRFRHLYLKSGASGVRDNCWRSRSVRKNNCGSNDVFRPCWWVRKAGSRGQGDFHSSHGI